VKALRLRDNNDGTATVDAQPLVVRDIQLALSNAEATAQTMATVEAAIGPLMAIAGERLRQDAKWGEQNHDPFTYLTVLLEEVGEFAQAALHLRFGGPAQGEFRKEAIHMAAVALAIVECIDRAKWTW